MELGGYLDSLRKHWIFITALTVLGAVGGFAAYVTTSPTYQSSVTFYVSTPLTDGSNPLSAGQFAQARVNSYVSLLQSDELANRVIQNQRLDMAPADVVEEIQATAELNTVLVTAEVRDRSADRSLAIARGIASTFGSMVDQLDNQGRKDRVVDINVVSGPTLAPQPVAPSLKRYGGLGLLLGLMLAVLAAVLRDLLDTTVRSNEAASDLVSAPVIGTIQYDPEAQRSPLLLADSGYSVRAEAFRQLRTNLNFVGAMNRTQVLMVTSSVPAEGKSITAANLAQSFVEFGDRVLLIEGDLRRSRLSSYFSLESHVGLSNVLAGQVGIDEVVQRWGTDELFILPSGAQPPNPSEILGSEAMVKLMAELRPKYDKIIIDTPPVLPVTDAAVCSALVDGVVFVVRWGRTHRTQVATAVQSLAQVDARVLGCVVNMRRVRRAERRRYSAEAYYTNHRNAG